MDCKTTCTVGANIAEAAFVGPQAGQSAYILSMDIDYYRRKGKRPDLVEEAKELLNRYKKASEAEKKNMKSVFQRFWEKALSTDKNFYSTWLYENDRATYNKLYN